MALFGSRCLANHFAMRGEDVGRGKSGLQACCLEIVVCATILLMCGNHYQHKFVNMEDDVVCMSWRFLHHGSIL